MSDDPSILDAALAYAARGWFVVPLHEPKDGRCSCDGALNCQPAKHPRTRHGFKDATTNPKTIRAWWTKWPTANIGIATERSGLVVLDVDPRHDGAASLELLIAEHGALDDTLHVRTGGGGSHYYFAAGEHGVASKANALGANFPGIDTRGIGGYVVAPASRHKSGGEYVQEASSVDTAAPRPQWLVAATAGVAGRASATAAEKGSKANAASGVVVEGGRTDWLVGIAASLRYRDANEEAVLGALRAVNTAQCSPSLPNTEVEAIARSYARRPGGEAWDGGESTVRGRHFTKMYDDISARGDLDSNDKLIYAYLARDAEQRANPKYAGRPLPMSAGAIGKHLHLAARTVLYVIGRLEERGFIRAFRSNGGRHMTNRYRLLSLPETVAPPDGFDAPEEPETTQPLQSNEQPLTIETTQPLQSNEAPSNPETTQPLQSNASRTDPRNYATDDTKLRNGCTRKDKEEENNQVAGLGGSSLEVSSSNNNNSKIVEKSSARGDESDQALHDELGAHGVSAEKIAELLETCEPSRIRRQLDWLPRRGGADRVGVLLLSIRDDWREPNSPP